MPQPSKVVLFDIDYTLFNTIEYRKLMFEALAAKSHYENKQELIDKAYELYWEMRKKSYYRSRDFSLLIKETLSLTESTEEIETILHDTVHFNPALYEETERVLKQLSDAGVTLGIFSGGERLIQEEKIRSLMHLFHIDHIHINEVNKAADIPALIEKYRDRELFLVDDLIQILEEIKEKNSDVLTIWIKRGIHAEQADPEFVPDKTVTHLSEILPFILK